MSGIKNLEELFANFGTNFEELNDAFTKMFSSKNECGCSCCYDNMSVKITESDDMRAVQILMPEIEKDCLGMEISTEKNGVNYVRIFAKTDIKRTFVNMKSDEDIKIPFGYDIDDSEIKAQLHNGVMTIYMPKRAKKDSKKAITIQ